MEMVKTSAMPGTHKVVTTVQELDAIRLVYRFSAFCDGLFFLCEYVADHEYGNDSKNQDA